MNSETLTRMHWAEGKSLRQMALELKSSKSTIRYYMNKLGIPIRDRNDGVRLHHSKTPLPLHPTPEVDKAYIAGFIDGEGYIGASKSSSASYRIRLIVGNTCRLPLERMKEVFGGAIHEHQKKAPKKTLYTWQASANTVDRILHSILPYLIIKREHARLVLELHTPVKAGRGRDPVSRNVTSSEAERRRVIYLKLRQLNRRGSHAT